MINIDIDSFWLIETLLYLPDSSSDVFLCYRKDLGYVDVMILEKCLRGCRTGSFGRCVSLQTTMTSTRPFSLF